MIQQLFFLPHCTFVREIKKKGKVLDCLLPLFQWTKTKVDHQMDVSKRIKLGKQPVPSRPSRRGIGFDLRYVLVCCLFMLSIFLLLGEQSCTKYRELLGNFFLVWFLCFLPSHKHNYPVQKKSTNYRHEGFFLSFCSFL